MTMGLADSLRNTRATDIITAAGASAKIKYYNGSRPAKGAAITSQALLATLTGGSVIGTATSGVITLGSVTQNNALHVTGTPTWVRITTSADVFVADLSIPADMSFTGTITTGVDITLGACTITEGNA